MPNTNGLQLAEGIFIKWPYSKMVILTSEANFLFYVDVVKKTGAVGFLHKLIITRILCVHLEKSMKLALQILED